MKILQRKSVFALFCILLLNVGFADAQEKSAAIDTLMQTLAEREQINGVVLAENNGKVIYNKGFGYANFEEKKPVNTETVFEIASVSKTFTSMAVMMLDPKRRRNAQKAEAAIIFHQTDSADGPPA